MRREIYLVVGLLLITAFIVVTEPSGPEKDPNIVLVTMESARFDYFGPCFESSLNTTPSTCSFAEDATSFTNAYSHATYTLPSLASLHTGKLPEQTQVFTPRDNLSVDEITIADFLKEQNYSTYAVVRSPFTHERYGFTQGFDQYVSEKVNTTSEVRTALETVDDADEPFFLWIHLYAPHQGYDPPEKQRGQFVENDHDISAVHIAREFDMMDLNSKEIEYLRNRYREELKYSDSAFGKLINGLKNRDLYSDSAIFFTGDHGEDLMDYGVVGHGFSLQEPVTNVPLIVKPPYDSTKDVIHEAVGTRDIFPTIKAILGEEKYRFDLLEDHDRKKVISETFGRKA